MLGVFFKMLILIDRLLWGESSPYDFLGQNVCVSLFLSVVLPGRSRSTLLSLCPLALSSAVNKSQQHQISEKIWECRELNLGQLGEKYKCYLCAVSPPKVYLSFFSVSGTGASLLQGITLGVFTLMYLLLVILMTR